MVPCEYRGISGGYNFQNKNLFLSLKIVFVLANSVDPDEMPRTSKRKIKFLNCQKKLFIFVGTP